MKLLVFLCLTVVMIMCCFARRPCDLLRDKDENESSEKREQVKDFCDQTYV